MREKKENGLAFIRGSSSVCACARHAHHYPACISVCVLEHLNHRAEIMFNYTCNNFKVSLDRETICMLITMTGVIAENKSYSCSLIRPDISALPLSAFPVDAETTCWRWKLFSGRGLACNAGDVRALAVDQFSLGSSCSRALQDVVGRDAGVAEHDATWATAWICILTMDGQSFAITPISWQISSVKIKTEII